MLIREKNRVLQTRRPGAPCEVCQDCMPGSNGQSPFPSAEDQLELAVLLKTRSLLIAVPGSQKTFQLFR